MKGFAARRVSVLSTAHAPRTRPLTAPSPVLWRLLCADHSPSRWLSRALTRKTNFQLYVHRQMKLNHPQTTYLPVFPGFQVALSSSYILSFTKWHPFNQFPWRGLETILTRPSPLPLRRAIQCSRTSCLSESLHLHYFQVKRVLIVCLGSCTSLLTHLPAPRAAMPCSKPFSTLKLASQNENVMSLPSSNPSMAPTPSNAF